MALNFSHGTFYGEDNLVSQMRIPNGYLVDGIPEKAEDGFEYGGDRSNRCGSQESVHKDILDLLPSDPFGMDLSTTFTAITGWLEDLEVDYGGYARDEVATSDGNYQLFAGLNFIWNNALRFQAFPGSMGFNHKLNVVGGFSDGCLEAVDADDASGSVHGAFGLDRNMEDILNLENDEGNGSPGENGGSNNPGFSGQEGGESEQDRAVCLEGNGEAPHSAFMFALGYLNVRDLLAVEAVSRSLHFAVRNDPYLWRSIHIEQPLNDKITDDVLLQLTNRAQGNLQCLSLVECQKITDDGLKHVLENNLRLTKLSVPGCTRLSIGCILTGLRAYKTMGMQGVKHLRIAGIYGVTQQHFEELKYLLGTDGNMQQNAHKPHFYNRNNFYLPYEDDRAIDLEMCPRCRNLRLVYDCPAQSCQGKENLTQPCRACSICILRCVRCGRCIDGEYEETFCLEFVCLDCGKPRP